MNNTTTTLSDELTQTLLEKASYIFNKKYTAYNQHKFRTGKTYIGVKVMELDILL
ncbi:MAG: hypothetical protein HC784_17305 [Hydrococcus sp. CSU_1_8]|nr:hypothetical protein [Hydrococcus sp. CSU_1_8]